MEKNIKNEETSNAHHITGISTLLQLKHEILNFTLVMFIALSSIEGSGGFLVSIILHLS